jgi:outer membrane protein
LLLHNNRDDTDMSVQLGAGADALFIDADDISGFKADVVTVYGARVNVGGDCFVTKDPALNLVLRGTIFPDADFSIAGRTVATYQPISFIGLFGARWFPWQINPADW